MMSLWTSDVCFMLHYEKMMNSLLWRWINFSSHRLFWWHWGLGRTLGLMAACDCVQCAGRQPVKWDMAPSIWAADLCALTDGRNESTAARWEGLMNLLPASDLTGQASSSWWIEPSTNESHLNDRSCAKTSNTRFCKSSKEKRVRKLFQKTIGVLLKLKSALTTLFVSHKRVYSVDFTFRDNGTCNWLVSDKMDGCLSLRESVCYLVRL